MSPPRIGQRSDHEQHETKGSRVPAPRGILEYPSPPVHARRLRWALSNSLPRELANHAVMGVPPSQ